MNRLLLCRISLIVILVILAAAEVRGWSQNTHRAICSISLIIYLRSPRHVVEFFPYLRISFEKKRNKNLFIFMLRPIVQRAFKFILIKSQRHESQKCSTTYYLPYSRKFECALLMKKSIFCQKVIVHKDRKFPSYAI